MRNTCRIAEFSRAAEDTRTSDTSPVHFYRLADVVSHFEGSDKIGLGRSWDRFYCAARDAKASPGLLCALHSIEDDIIECESVAQCPLDSTCDIDVHEDGLEYLESHLDEVEALLKTAHPEDLEPLQYALEALSHLREDLPVLSQDAFQDGAPPQAEGGEGKSSSENSFFIDLESEKKRRTVDECLSLSDSKTKRAA
jgi:hypothetical protein